MICRVKRLRLLSALVAIAMMVTLWPAEILAAPPEIGGNQIETDDGSISATPAAVLGDVVISIAAISGVTAPVTGAAPVTSITETDQYTGTVSWSPAVSSSFDAATAYTAIITLTPKAGYTLTGVADNSFTVAGATTVSNAANSGEITAVFPATAAYVCEVSTDPTTRYASLDAALAAVASGQTITMLQNIDHPGGMVIDGKAVTFNLNGHILNVGTGSAPKGITVKNGGKLLLSEGAGQLNVTASGNAVETSGSGSSVTVTNATSTNNTAAYADSGGNVTVKGEAAGKANGAYANGYGSSVTVAKATSADGVAAYAISGSVSVQGDAVGKTKGIYASAGTVTVGGDAKSTNTTAASRAVEVWNGGQVIVNKDVIADAAGGSCGIYVGDQSSRVTVRGNVHGRSVGVDAFFGTVTIDGNVATSSDDSVAGYGVRAQLGAKVIVKGSISTNNHASSVGAQASNTMAGSTSSIIVDGTITGTTYIKLGENKKTQSDFTTPSTKAGYLTYTQTVSGSTSTVWVKATVTPPVVLAAPTGLAWDETTPGKAKWDTVTNASSYSVQLYKGDAVQGEAITGVTAAEYDFTAAIAAAGNGSYTFKVTAIGDGTTYSNSPQSAASPAYIHAAPVAVCEVSTSPATPYTSLDAALAAVVDGQTITLLQNIDHPGNMVIDVKAVTLNLNSYTLNVGHSSADNGLKAQNGGKLILQEGPGQLNVIAKGNAVEASGGGSSVTVTSAASLLNIAAYADNGGSITVRGDATGNTSGAHATGAGSKVTVGGDTRATSDNGSAAEATSSGQVMVSGNARSTGKFGKAVQVYSGGQATVMKDAIADDVGSSCGVKADGSNSKVTVTGHVHGKTYGVDADNSAEVIVEGNVSTGSDADSWGYGVRAQSQAKVRVMGNVSANNNTSSVGAWAGNVFTESPTEITVDGTISGYAYIALGGNKKASSDTTTPSTRPGYHTYTQSDDGCISTVWVKNTSIVELATPTGLAWDETTPGKAKWDPVVNASSCSVQLYKDGAVQGALVEGITAAEHDFSAAITAAGNGSYTFKVTAIGDGTAYLNSPQSALSPAYDYRAPDTVINISAILGVTAPATGAAPVTAIAETDQYAGIVSWSPAVASTFAAETPYTATITLTPKAGYTLTGVAENFFTVAGATVVRNLASSGMITAQFPPTVASGGPTGTAVWQTSSPLPASSLIEDIKYLNGRYIAVGYNGTLITSTDGENWAKVSIETEFDRLGGIAYGGGKYVLVGHVNEIAGRIYTSSDGVSWHETAAIPYQWLHDVTYGNGTFVAVGSAGKILISADGENWVTKTVTYPNGQETTLLSITYSADKGKFVAAGMGSDTGQHKGGIVTSADGENWTVTYSDAYYTLWDVTYGNGKYVAVGGTNNGTYFLATSDDGINWTKPVNWPDYATLFSVEYDGARFVAAGSTNGGTGRTAFATFSTDGVTWSSTTPAGLPGFRAVASNGSRLVAMASYGNIYTSDNAGSSWTYRTFGTTKTLKDVAYNGSNLYVAVGYEGTIQTSPDGQRWTIQSSGTTKDLNRVDYLGGQFVAVGKNGTILTSPDGTAWTSQTSGATQELKGLAYGGGRYMVVGGAADSDPVVLTSSDGVSWTNDTTGVIPRSFVSVAYGDGVFLAVMQYGQAYRYSVDLDGKLVGTKVTDLGGGGCYPTDITYGGGKFVAVGGYGEVYLTANKGSSWTVQESDLDSYSWGIAYGGGNFAAVSDMGKIMASADGGTTWLLQPSGLSYNHYSSDNHTRLNGIVAGDNCFVAVGEDGLVLHSANFTVSADADSNDVNVAQRALYSSHILGSGLNSSESYIRANMNLMTSWNKETTISWASSKPTIIATDGTVIRPPFGAGNQVVYLTATIRKGSAAATKTFIVVVVEAENPDIGDVSAAAAALTFETIKAGNTATNNITANLNLPTTGTNGTTITWTSNKPDFIATNGAVTRPAEGQSDEDVVLTATITKGEVRQTKTFYLTVKAQISQDAADVAKDKEALTFAAIKAANSGADNITSNLTLPITGTNGTTITWASSRPDTIAADGTVTRPAPGASDQMATLTATITKGTVTDTKTFTLIIKPMPVATYTVTVNGSYAGTTGAGSYLQNATITLNAGSRSGYSFAGWSSADGVTFANSSSSTTTFAMPAKNVTVTAAWSYSGGSSGGGGTPDPYTPPANQIFIIARVGGKLTYAGLTMTVPANALPANATLTILKLTAKDLGSLVPAAMSPRLASDPYEIKTTGTRDLGEQKITVKLPYDPTKIAQGAQPVIHYYDETAGQWVALATETVQENGKWYAVALTSHLGKFAVFSTPIPEEPKEEPVEEPIEEPVEEPTDEPTVISLTIGQKTVHIGEQLLELDVRPYIKNGRTLVPLRFISEALGAQVEWYDANQQVIIRRDKQWILLIVGSNRALVSGTQHGLECAPEVIEPGRTMVPLRFISEVLGAQVAYDDQTGVIRITMPNSN